MTAAVTNTKTSLDFRNATSTDLPRVEKLLIDADLPLDGVREQLANFLLVVNEGEELIGTAALELYGKTALLRSVAVESTQRGKGLGQELVSRVLERAYQEGFESVVLLTTTAENFFLRFGFEEISREAAPDPVKESVEFKGACPDTARVMLLDLKRLPLVILPATLKDIGAITRIYNQGIEDSCTLETELRSQEEQL